MRRPTCGIALVSLALLMACDARRQEAASPGVMPLEEYVGRVEFDRAEREERLRSPTGWLTVVGLFWLDFGASSIGSDASVDVVLPSPLPPVIGRIELEADGGELFVHRDASVLDAETGERVERLALVPGEPTGATAFLVAGRRFFLSRFGDRFALRMQDAESAARVAFPGNEYFPIEPRWRVAGRIEPHASPRRFEVPTYGGGVGEIASGGVLVFQLEGRERRLDVLRAGVEQRWLFTIFSDSTSGDETYPAGRYLWAERISPNSDRVVIDFNTAYNPPCVYTMFALCELAPPQNRLDLAVRAGEKRYSGPVAGDSWR